MFEIDMVFLYSRKFGRLQKYLCKPSPATRFRILPNCLLIIFASGYVKNIRAIFNYFAPDLTFTRYSFLLFMCLPFINQRHDGAVEEL